jgi:hypothetical protein
MKSPLLLIFALLPVLQNDFLFAADTNLFARCYLCSRWHSKGGQSPIWRFFNNDELRGADNRDLQMQ